MSVVAWDGKTIASDRMSVNNELKSSTKKLFKLETGEILGITGGECTGLAMVKWYSEGMKDEFWPHSQNSDTLWARLIIVKISGVIVYEWEKAPITVEEPFMAWGSGRDFAIGAMAKGATAIQAVNIASRFCTSCGMGVDWYEVERPDYYMDITFKEPEPITGKEPEPITGTYYMVYKHNKLDWDRK